MQLILRNKDVVTGDMNLEDLYSLADFPVFMGCGGDFQGEDIVAEMTWSISRTSGVIQLKKLIPLDILYSQSHHSGSVGGIWTEHHKSLSQFINRHKPSSVFEIGGAHGILAKLFQQFSKIPWTILEPNPSPVEGCDARFIKGFFDDKFLFEEVFDTVVHSHVFEHIYEPDQFMRHLAGFMDEGKHLIFSLPNMKVMLERKYTNCINFEHTVFLTEPYVEFLLTKHGFRLIDKEYFMDDHSIFYAAVRDGSVNPSDLPCGLYEKNKHLYMDYVHYHENMIQELNNKISDSTQHVYLFGAHVFAQYLIAFGLDTKRIVGLLDNDTNKHGNRLYGTNLMVQSPKILKDEKDPIVILKAGVYNDEIKKDILNNINPDVEFI